jgi:hypothetical protein
MAQIVILEMLHHIPEMREYSMAEIKTQTWTVTASDEISATCI